MTLGEYIHESWNAFHAKSSLSPSNFITNLFNHGSNTCFDIADPSSDELKRIMRMNGGVFHHYPSPKTTHYIATNLPDVKMKALKGNEVIVSPKWIVDSLESGHLLDYKKYLIYSKQTSSQPRINFPLANQSNISSPAAATGKGQALDAKSDKFLSEFYNNSRLHLISTMAADYKKYVSDLRSQKPKPWEFPDRLKLQGSLRAQDANVGKIIAHIDMVRVIFSMKFSIPNDWSSFCTGLLFCLRESFKTSRTARVPGSCDSRQGLGQQLFRNCILQLRGALKRCEERNVPWSSTTSVP